MRFHKFGFELDAELQWIKDHIPLASSTALGQNLHQTQSLYKKHKKLDAEITGHQSMIDKTLQTGQALIEQMHPENKKVTIISLNVVLLIKKETHQNLYCQNDNGIMKHVR